MRDKNQVVLPIDLEICIPKGDFVFKVAEICESLDYSELFATYVGAPVSKNLFRERVHVLFYQQHREKAFLMLLLQIALPYFLQSHKATRRVFLYHAKRPNDSKHK